MRQVITLAMEDWAIVVDVLGSSPMPTDTMQHQRQYRLFERLVAAMQYATSDSLGVELTSDQKQRLVAVIINRTPAWRLDATPRINAIKESLGWRAPNYGDGEDDNDA